MFLPSKPRSHPKEAQRPQIFGLSTYVLAVCPRATKFGMITYEWEERVLGSARDEMSVF